MSELLAIHCTIWLWITNGHEDDRAFDFDLLEDTQTGDRPEAVDRVTDIPQVRQDF